MNFWDSSALVPLLVEEDRSRRCRALRRADKSIVVWMMTSVEILSAVRRRAREGLLGPDGLKAAEKRLVTLQATWREIEAANAVRDRAERLIRIHPLTSADSLQLAAAVLAAGDRPRRHGFITADEALAAAASAEGFAAVIPGGE